VTAVTASCSTRDRPRRGACSVEGRPARAVARTVGGAASAFGVKVAPDHLVGVRVDLDARLVERYEVAFDPTGEAQSIG